ncbi:MAG: hypothetical protein KDA41_20865 [Planctomycetales bacterium]|nr:hypothetical protein [Planctomycetales bacterium]
MTNDDNSRPAITGESNSRTGLIALLFAAIFFLFFAAWIFWSVEHFLEDDDWVIAFLLEEVAAAFGFLGLAAILPMAFSLLGVAPPRWLLSFGEWAVKKLHISIVILLIAPIVVMLVWAAWIVIFDVR